ncbi:MAG: DUF2865 domain-containing protein [Devosia sp.]
MVEAWRIAQRWVGAFAAAALLVFAFVPAAVAQTATCRQLYATLASLERNGDFRNADRADADMRALQQTMQDAQSAYNRSGCQDAQQQGFPQTPECRAYARQYLSAQGQVKKLQQSAAKGGAIAQQREAVLQEIARFGCGQNQSASSGDQYRPRRPRNFLEDLFGGFSGGDSGYGDTYSGDEEVEDPYANQRTGNTIRTVCVRLSDGYYWPISFSTLPDYIPQDAQACQASCPGQQVDLYYYDNPGQEPEQMINAEGQAYSSLPSAFAYRKQVDPQSSCKVQQAAGQITVDNTPDGERAMISYAGETFPLPLRDPRRGEHASTVAAAFTPAVDIPLPRPRPSPNATAAAAAPPAESVVSAKSRVVRVGDKMVRVVGPDTPYAPATEPAGNSG